MQNFPYDNEFNWHENAFSQQWSHTKTRSDTEGKGNSEVAYSVRVEHFPLFQEICMADLRVT